MGELPEARAVSVHHKDLALAMCRHKREEDVGTVRRPIRVRVLVSRVRVGELAHSAAIGVGREDRSPGLIGIQKALPGDPTVRAYRSGVLGRADSWHRSLLAWCGWPTGCQERGQQGNHEERWNTAFHRCVSFLSIAS